MCGKFSGCGIPNNYALCIYLDTHVRASLREGVLSDAWNFPTITHYEFIQTRTTVRLYERVYYQMRGFPNNYAL